MSIQYFLQNDFYWTMRKLTKFIDSSQYKKTLLVEINV